MCLSKMIDASSKSLVVEINEHFKSLLDKQYHCCKCIENVNTLVSIKTIMSTIDELLQYTKKLRRNFIYISLKKKDDKSFGCQECLRIFTKDLVQFSLQNDKSLASKLYAPKKPFIAKL